MAEQVPDREGLQELHRRLQVLRELAERMKQTAEQVKAKVDIERVNEALRILGYVVRKEYRLLAEELEISYDAFAKKFNIKLLGEVVATTDKLGAEEIDKILRDREIDIAAQMYRIIEKELLKLANRIADIVEAYDYCRDEVEHLNSKITALEEECSCGD